jgi:hypothetical protein
VSRLVTLCYNVPIGANITPWKLSMFAQLCEQTHSTLVMGTCPWCGCQVVVAGKNVNPYRRCEFPELLPTSSHSIKKLTAKLDREFKQNVALTRAGLLGLGDEWFRRKIREAAEGDARSLDEIVWACRPLIHEVLRPWILKHREQATLDEMREPFAMFMQRVDSIKELVQSYSGTSALEFWELARGELTRHWMRIIGEL